MTKPESMQIADFGNLTDVEYLVLYRPASEEIWSAEGHEGIGGLKLIADSMMKVFSASYVRPEQDRQRQNDASIEVKRVVAGAKKSDTTFIACYRITDEPYGEIVWSDDLQPCDAYDELVQFVRGGLMLDH